jgi:hypothetical protein
MGGIMELRVTGLTREQMDHLNAQAAEANMSRTAYVKWQLLGGDLRPMSEAELGMLLAAKAREGNMRALELLMRRTAAPRLSAGEPEAPASPLAEVIALADRGAKA